MTNDEPRQDATPGPSNVADDPASGAPDRSAGRPARAGKSSKEGTAPGASAATGERTSFVDEIESEAGDDVAADADAVQSGEPLDPATHCAWLMLRAALEDRPDFVRRSAEAGVVSVIEVPTPAWSVEVFAAWSLVSAGLAFAELSSLDDAVAAAVRRRRDQSRRGSAFHDRRGVTDPFSVLAFERRSRTESSNDFRDAVLRGRAVLGVSHQPDALLPEDLLLGEDQRLIVRPPDASILAELATALAEGGGTPSQGPLCFPKVLAAVSGTVTPVLVTLAKRRGQTPEGYLERLAALVTRREAAAGLEHRPMVTLDDLPGLGHALEWGRHAAADLRAYADGELPWTELDRGVVLEGPPGCGKSTFARALANSAGVSFAAASLAEWQGDRDGHLGHLLGAMRSTFEKARRQAPCVLLVDEIDGFPRRSSVKHRHRDYVIEVVNGLLEQLDGAVPRDGVLVIGTCNDASNLDPALTRAGRLERVVRLGRPDAESLVLIFRVHLAGALPGADLRPIAAAAEARQAVGADVERWCRDARRLARSERRDLSIRDLAAAVGEPPPERDQASLQRIAVHEAGHALGFASIAPELLEHIALARTGMGSDFTAIDTGALSAVRPMLTRTDAREMLTAVLAGRAAEEAFLGEPSAGAGGSSGSDLGVATRLACLLVGTYGLDRHSEALVYRGSPGDLEGCGGLLGDPSIRRRVAAMLRQSHADALELVLRHREGVTRLADALVQRGAIEAEEALALLGPLHVGGVEGASPPSGRPEAVSSQENAP